VVPIQRERITLAEALAAAGGPIAAQGRKEIAVLRGGHAKPQVYTVDLEVALLHDDRIALRPGDRVIIAPTGLATASRYMNQILPFLTGAQAAGLAASGGSNVAAQAAAAQTP
jgi:protein involved in polysaccharide export with SLBB domain